MAQRSQQLALNFEPGLTAKHRALEDCIAHTVHAGKGVDTVAQQIDMAPSELSRRLNAHLRKNEGEANNRPLRVSDMLDIMRKTEDYSPIYWQIEEFLQDPEARRDAVIAQLAQVAPQFFALVEQAGIQIPKTAKR